MLRTNDNVKDFTKKIRHLSQEEKGFLLDLHLEACDNDGLIDGDFLKSFYGKFHARKRPLIDSIIDRFFTRLTPDCCHFSADLTSEWQQSGIKVVSKLVVETAREIARVSEIARANINKRWHRDDTAVYTNVYTEEKSALYIETDSKIPLEGSLESKKESFQKNTKKVFLPEQSATVAKSATAQKANSILSKPDDVCEQVWQDYLALRRAKKAPISATLMKTLRSEADKAKLSLEKALEMCINRNWQGFRADWLPSVAAPLPKPKPVLFNPNNAPPLKENVEILGIYNPNEENALADSIKNITRL